MKKWLVIVLSWVISVMGHTAPLPAKEVFQVAVQVTDPNTVSLHWQIREGYFLYRDRISIALQKNSGVQIGELRLPKAVIKIDEQHKTLSIYRNKLSLPIALLSEKPGTFFLTLRYQGCSDKGFCYPPEIKSIKVVVGSDLALKQAVFTVNPGSLEKPLIKNAGNLVSLFSKNYIVIFLSFFGFGLLLAFTPCVLPMIPVLSGIIIGQKRPMSSRKAFGLSAIYVLSMAITYALVGAVIALFGQNIQIIMQSPVIISLFGGLFILLALSMFGYFNIALPLSVQNKIAVLTRSQSGSGYIGVAIMGSLSILILSPCVTPPLIGVLSYIANKGSLFIGSLSLFFLGLGMGLPLLLIGTVAGQLLPKAGAWMNGVKVLFGIMLLVVAIFLFSRVAIPALTMLMWATLLVGMGIYGGAFDWTSSLPYKLLRQTISIMLFIYGVLILIGLSMGHTHPELPLKQQESQVMTSAPVIVKTQAELQQALRAAKGRLIMLDFYADWCNSCSIIENTVFKNKEVLALLNFLKVIKVDMTKQSSDMHALLAQFDVIAPPVFIFLDPQGKEFPTSRLIGEINSANFSAHLANLVQQQ